jgi:ethanolaminephosphotransferase
VEYNVGADGNANGQFRRRTHQSGPLGELFDHGVDAVNTTLEVVLFSACMNLGQGWKTVLIQFACMLLAAPKLMTARN